jgi:predicted RND superfamily exporter protein
LVRETQREVPGVNTGIIGEPVLEYDEMQQSKKDTTLATAISLFLCALIFIYGYQETGRPVKATICLIIGLGYTMGFTTLVVGHLNILTITFAPMLIGMAIDFGVHLVTRYEEELRHGKTEREALKRPSCSPARAYSLAVSQPQAPSLPWPSPISRESRKWESLPAVGCLFVLFQ